MKCTMNSPYSKLSQFALYTILVNCIFFLSSCTDKSELTYGADMGPNPTISAPSHKLLPTINVSPASSWPKNMTPLAAPGLKVNAFAQKLDHPRWLYVLPNGDVLVAETNAPPKPDDNKGIKGLVMKSFMKLAGSVTPSANRITLLRDTDGDGKVDFQRKFLEGLNSPFGMAVIGNNFYVANTDSIMRFPYHTGDVHLSLPGEKIADLPAGPLNHHWTKNIISSLDNRYLYATVGSNSNVGENGINKEKDRAAILEINLTTHKKRIFASGLRNPNGLSWQPESKKLWTVVNERDELGSDLVPDYMTSVKEGAFYGWPYSYFGQNIDKRVKPTNPDLIRIALKPDYALGAHTASLGLTFYNKSLFPDKYMNGAFIGQHGSWNRIPPSGYKVVFVPFKNGMPIGMPEDILSGFLDKRGNAMGRPVGVAIDKQGALLIADDVGNTIWRVVPK